MKLLFLTILLLLFQTPLLLGQADSTTYDFGDFGGIVYLDSLVVTASRQGFDVQDFIRKVREDKSFYAAFDNLRTLSYQSDNTIVMYRKNGKEKAAYRGKIQQYSDGDCRVMEVIDEQISGNFFKRRKSRKHRYYTAKMHDRLFYSWGKICESKVVEPKKPRGMDKHVAELKKLIFQPGERAEVPLIGKKMEIFSKKMQPFYNYSISSERYRDIADCYVFTARVKPAFLKKKAGKTVFKLLKTYFDKESWQIVARDYELRYKSPLFDFDVKMNVELGTFEGHYIPELIQYDGYWDIPAKKPEISQFSLKFYQFEPAQPLPEG
ncbi:MAG: hypothetical protein AAGG75_18245 [Bacteroidota bacterium]